MNVPLVSSPNVTDQKFGRIISGRIIAQNIVSNISKELINIKDDLRFEPVLAILEIGTRDDSCAHVRQQVKAARQCGIRVEIVLLDSDSTLDYAKGQIRALNENINVHGIILQLPIVSTHKITADDIVNEIDPDKDVDGLSNIQGQRFMDLGAHDLYENPPSLVHVPCAAAACFLMLRETGVDLAASCCAVLGRGRLVGVPVAKLLSWATKSSFTYPKESLRHGGNVSEADIVISGVGVAHFVKGAWIKPGAIVLDCGINVLNCGGNRKIVGDVEFEEAKHRASWITPVPGGIGPVAVALLLRNTLNATKKICKLTTHRPLMEPTGLLLSNR